MHKYLKYIYTTVIVAIFLGCGEDPVEIITTGTLTGIVVTDGTNLPIENARVSTNPSTSTVFTDENGEFIIENIAEDQYSVQAELDGFITGFEGANVTGGSTINVVIDLRPDNSDNRPPTTPVLFTPTDGQIDVPIETEFVWTSSDPDEDEITYGIEIRNDFDDEIIVFESLTDTMQVVSNLRFGLQYFWQVSASDGINEEPTLSPISSFETVAIPPNRIVFVREMGNNNVIFSGDEEGENELQLTPSTMNSFRPRRNNAASRIAFLSNNGAETHIFTISPNGDNLQQITSAVPVNGFNLDEIDFVWTEDGGQLLYSNFDRLYSINSDGTDLRQIYQTTDGSFITEVAISADESTIVLKTNDVNGYNVSIFSIDNSGNIIDTVLSGLPGAAGGLDISVDNQEILYWYDVSGFESPDFRQLDSRVFVFDTNTSTTIDLSEEKVSGTNDFDCRFVPNEASVIITNTSNDGISQRDVIIITRDNLANRGVIFSNAEMPDFE